MLRITHKSCDSLVRNPTHKQLLYKKAHSSTCSQCYTRWDFNIERLDMVWKKSEKTSSREGQTHPIFVGIGEKVVWGMEYRLDTLGSSKSLNLWNTGNPTIPCSKEWSPNKVPLCRKIVIIWPWIPDPKK